MPKEDDTQEVLRPTSLDEVLADETAKIEEEDESKSDDNENGTGDQATNSDSEEKEGETKEDGSASAEASSGESSGGVQEDNEPYVEETPPVVQDLPADVKTYVDEKLPDVEVWGRDGQDGKVQKFTVKSAFDLPDDFIPRSYKDQQIQGQQFAKQDRLTSKYEDEFIQAQADNAKAEEQAQLEASWSVELKAAQSAGRIPQIKSEAETDEGFKKAAEVIEYMRQENDKLVKINAPYRIKSFTQALDLYEANELKVSKTEETNREDSRKSKQGSMIGSGRGSKDQFSKLPTAGTKLEDVLAEYAA